MAEKILQVKNLKTYFHTQAGLVKAVNDVSFDVEKGKTLGIVGESGCGKSITSLSIMGLVEKPGKIEGGEILFAGEDLLKKTEDQMRQIRGKQIAMIFQEPMTSLNPVYTIGEQITEALLLHEHMTNRQARERGIEMLKLVKIPLPERRFDEYPHQLSGGMRQRVMIAMALCCNPEMLICDEPTTALDVTIQAKIIELIRRVQKERGISVIYITHDLGVVAKVADYVNVMYAGKIVEKGMINEIFYDPKHPYTWGLLSAMPDLDTADERLYTIPGSPPNLLNEKPGDAFAPRNQFALEIDDKADPPMFQVTDTHYAATWLLDPRAPKAEMPPELKERIARMKKEAKIDDGE